MAHSPVLLAEALDGLAIKPAGTYVDATFGRGGHAAGILERLGPDGSLLAFDQDPDAVAAARQRFANEPRFQIRHARFDGLGDWIAERGLQGRVDGVLFDLGVSSPQLDNAERGFSFSRSGPLDMRMNPQAGESAAQWLARAEAEEIANVLWRYADERQSRRIARAIVEARAERPLTTTGQLAALIKQVVHQHPAVKTHPATRSFQAIRIHVNDELGALERVLPQAQDALAVGGRLVVISFHSLEDRLVKRYLRAQARPEAPPMPMAPMPIPSLRLCGGAVRAGDAELAQNPRARSSVLRAAESLDAARLTPEAG